MVNKLGLDAYGTDCYNRTNGGIWMPREGFGVSNPREVINFTEVQRQEQIVRQYVKLNNNGLYEVKIPGRPTTVFYSEADAIRNCRYQLTNTYTPLPAGNAPANTAGNTPANAAGNAPANAAGNTPANAAGNAPANAAGNTPANAAGNAPANAAGNTPANAAGNAPANTAGNTPANAAGNAPANTAGNAPANTAGNAPANAAGNAPENAAGNAPENQPTQKPKSKNIFKRFGGWVSKTWKSGAKGKAGLIIGGLALVGGLVAGAIALFGGKDKKAEEVKPEDTTSPVAVPPTDETPAEETPAPVTEEPEAPVQQAPADETPADVSENIIQNGDTLEAVANRYGVTVDELKELNADKIKKFPTADGREIEGFIVGEDIKLPEGTKKVEGLRNTKEARSDYDEYVRQNLDSFPQTMWNQLCTPEFRRKNKIGEYKPAA